MNFVGAFLISLKIFLKRHSNGSQQLGLVFGVINVFSRIGLGIDAVSNQIKSSLYSRCYAEACNEWRGPSPRLSAWATQLRRNVATVVSRWRHCADLTGPGIEPQASRTERVRLPTELTAGLSMQYNMCNYSMNSDGYDKPF